MSDRRKEAEEKMAKAIFISADCWLSVFDLLPAYQLGLGIALISHRFDFYVDEHFKTRKWALKYIRIRNKIGENGTDEMEIVNFGQKALPIPPIQLPRKVTGFQRIEICFIDQNAIAFLRHFRQLFAACPINLVLYIHNDHISGVGVNSLPPIPYRQFPTANSLPANSLPADSLPADSLPPIPY
ncbi:hypothetical protein niasHT_005496 [Heterodera trifolii]|uniref:Uncharacterized protein n=1 Tax=Heterodera trifolii TaxID=157864 RepID=A0ABD2LSS7_9BILA